jgi:hypothetical protein
MKTIVVFHLIITTAIIGFAAQSFAQAPASQDTIYVTGGTLSGQENAGSLEKAINGDTTTTGQRINPNRVYALYEGQVYYQLAPIYVYDPTGVLTVVGVPDPSHPSAKAKPIILLEPTGTVDVAAGKVYGSIKFVNIHCQVMELDGNMQSEYFYCGTANQIPQKLTIDNCLFEFSNIDLFDCTNESGAIGGWPYGASFFITNSYFRNMFEPSQWWGSRVFQCKHPIDTMWIENCTVTTGGLTFLQQNELTDFCYINHNTIINQKKYWLLSPYHHNFFVTNNIFVNQNWVGEDTNVTNSGQDPDRHFMSTIDIEANSNVNGEVVQPKYMVGGDPASIDTSQLGLEHLRVFVSDNDNFYDPLLISNYYQSPTYILADTGTAPNTGPFNAIPSYLRWFYNFTAPVRNIPGEWMNDTTKALFDVYLPPQGGFVEERTWTANPNTQTPVTASAVVIDAMAQWNQNQYGDPRFKTPTSALTSTAYIYGDYSPTTLPGIVGGVRTDNVTQSTVLLEGDQVGISKFTDLAENFSQSTIMSAIDGFPIGALMWDDIENANYPGGWQELGVVERAYNAVPGIADGLLIDAVKTKTTDPGAFALLQNYPNPFNPTTQISYTIPQNGNVTLKVFNVLGQEVSTLFAGEQTTGQHFVTFDGSRLASGVYLYRLESGNTVVTKKMMLMK